MKKCIGIISYLPDDTMKRQLRGEKLKGLVNTCNSLFNLPIFIIIQNYTEDEIKALTSYENVTVSENFTKCGITGARRKLREWFLNSKYDCLIMLDDDCDIHGTKVGAKTYLEELESHKNSFGEFRGTQLKLFSITKDILSEVDFDNVNPEDGDGFEDTIFVNRLRKQFPDKKFTYSKYELKELSPCANDELSTWYSEQDLQSMLAKTREKVDSL